MRRKPGTAADPKEVADRRKLLQQKGFAQVFRRGTQGAQGDPPEHGPPSEDIGHQAPDYRNQRKQDEAGDTGDDSPAQAARFLSQPTYEGFTPVATSNRFAQLAESIRAEE
eukprot:5868754-Heterocapsa_arctica.AAC.1